MGSHDADESIILPYPKDPQAPRVQEDLFWHYPHYHWMGAQPYGAIRE